MNSITIKGTDLALQAGFWCKKQGFKWDIDLSTFSNDPIYTFRFNNPVDASFFALKWGCA